MAKVHLIKLVSGELIIGKIEGIFRDEEEKENKVQVADPLLIGSGKDAKGQDVFFLARWLPIKGNVVMLKEKHIMLNLGESPQNLTDLYLQSTSSIQIASTKQVSQLAKQGQGR